MEFDVWFARDNEGQLWFNLADPDKSPDTSPSPCKSVKDCLDRLHANGHTVAQVGIADMDMIR